MYLKNLFLVLFLFASVQGFSQACVSGAVKSTLITYSGKSGMTISGLRIESPTQVAEACIYLINCHDITVTNCILGPSFGEGIRLDDCYNITITNCVFIDNRTGVYVTNSFDNIKVDNNQFCNIHGPYPRGQVVQFSGVTGAGDEIAYNVAENVPGNSTPVDLINLYQSSGTASSPISIKGNKLRGGGPDTTGGGIITGDDGGAYVTAQDNILVDPGQYGMAVASGHDIQLLNNQIFGREQSFTNVGIYAYDLYQSSGLTCSNVTVSGNQVNFINKGGQNNPWYGGDPAYNNTCGTITGFNTNVWSASFGPEILPNRLLCPVLMAYYPFNGSRADNSGTQINAVASGSGAGFGNDGKDFSSASFDGTAYLNLPQSDWLNITSNRLTISCWIKPSTLQGIQGITCSQNGDGWNNGWRMLFLNGGFNPRIVTTQGAADVFCGGIQAGVWTYVTMTYDGQNLKGYVNGVLQGTTALSGNILYGSSGGNMLIGYSYGDNYYFNGHIDEFRFYNGDMNADEILQEYNNSKDLVNSPRTLLASYKFNGSWADNSGNNLTLINSGAGFVCDGEDAVSVALNGAALLSLPTATLLRPSTSQFTVSCWIKPSVVTGIQGIARSQDGDGWSTGWRILLLDNTLNARVITTQGPVDIYCGGIQAGVWNQVVVTYDGGALKGYVNGVLQGSTALGGYIQYGASANMLIGYSNGSNYYFNGHIDEFRFYNGTVLADEILQDYTSSNLLINNPPVCPLSVGVKEQTLTSETNIAGGDYYVYPNPVINGIMVSSKTAFRATLYNAMGQLVRTAASVAGQLRLNVEGLEAGLYYLHINNEKSSTTKKILVSR